MSHIFISYTHKPLEVLDLRFKHKKVIIRKAYYKRGFVYNQFNKLIELCNYIDEDTINMKPTVKVLLLSRFDKYREYNRNNRYNKKYET